MLNSQIILLIIDITVDYIVENGEKTPIVVPNGSSAQRVMEAAAIKNNTYDFTATYYGKYSDYFVETLAGKSNGNDHYWVFYYKPPGQKPYKPNVGIEQFIIPCTGGVLLWEYEKYISPAKHPQLIWCKKNECTWASDYYPDCSVAMVCSI